MIIPDKTHDFEEVAGFDFRREDQIKDKQSALQQGRGRDRFRNTVVTSEVLFEGRV